MRLHLLTLATVLALALGGCGGSAPTSPAAGPVLIVRDGATEDRVNAQATPPSPSPGTPVTLRAPGYLVREQRFDGSPIFLWPTDNLVYVRLLVYGVEFPDGTRRLVRWERGFTVTLEGDLAEDRSVVARTREVLAEVSRVTGLALALGGGGEVVIGLDPSVSGEDAVGVASLSFRDATIVGARLGFVSRRELAGEAGADYRNTLLHEMGHALGLAHSVDPRDVMTPGGGPGTFLANFGPGEALSLHMMYRRRSAGNIYPDRDPALGPAAAGLGLRRVEIVD